MEYPIIMKHDDGVTFICHEKQNEDGTKDEELTCTFIFFTDNIKEFKTTKEKISVILTELNELGYKKQYLPEINIFDENKNKIKILN